MANDLIKALKLGSDTHVFTLPYATCTVAQSAAEKVATVQPEGSVFVLETGARVSVKFTNGACAAAELNVNSTGRKPISVKGYDTDTTSWEAGDIVEFIYDGANWVAYSGTQLCDGCAVAGLMSPSDKIKLEGIADNATYNPNVFTTVVADSTSIPASGRTDTIKFTAGSNVTLTPSVTGKSIQISAKDTVYTHPTATSRSAGIYKITVNNLGHVTGATSITNDAGKIKSEFLDLPAQVDEIIEGYLYNGKFYKESAHTNVLPAEDNKIYLDLATNKVYRYGSTTYVEISASLALGNTSSTAAKGDHIHPVNGTTGSATLTPAGTIAATFTGTEAGHTHTVSVSGSHDHSFTGTAAEHNHTGTVSGGKHTHSLTLAPTGHTHSFAITNGGSHKHTLTSVTKSVSFEVDYSQASASFSGTAHKHSFSKTATTGAPTGSTSVLTSVKSAGTLPSYSTTNASFPTWTLDAGSFPTLTSSGGTAPSLTSSVTGQTLVLTFGAGSHKTYSLTGGELPSITKGSNGAWPTFTAGAMPTFNTGSVASTAHTHSVTVSGDTGETTATGTVSVDGCETIDISIPGFVTGMDNATVSFSGTSGSTVAGITGSVAETTPTGYSLTINNKSITPAGTVGSKTITVTGTAAEKKLTPAGSVSATFTGTAATHSHNVDFTTGTPQ